jgi:hypothetical protein
VSCACARSVRTISHQRRVVHTPQQRALLVQERERPSAAALLDQLAHRRVVEQGHGLPGHALSSVFLLLLAQRAVQDQLLQLVVAVVDARTSCSARTALFALLSDAARIQLRYLQQDPLSLAHSGLDAIIVRALEDDHGDRDREIERSYGVPALVAPFVTGTAVSLG